MKRVLLTGMSGTGKSTVIRELATRGYKAVDTDYGRFSEQVPIENDAALRDATPQYEWLWREDRIERLLSTEDADVLFVSGCVRNQLKFYPRFDHVILLSAPIEVMLSRLTARTTNPYGKRPDEQTEVRSLKQTVEPALRRAASSEIDTNAPLDAVVAAVLNSVR